MVVVAMEIGDDGAGDGAFVDLGSSSIHIMYILCVENIFLCIYVNIIILMGFD